MPAVVIRITISTQSQALLEAHKQRPALLRRELAGALKQGLEETGAHLQARYLTGGSHRVARGGSVPLAVRSGALRASVATEVDQPPYSGFVGTKEGPASVYARMLLDQGTTTIRPKNAKHLWIPIADNLNPSGVMRMSPRDVMGMTNAKGKKLARIFVSKRGNKVVFLADPQGGSYSKGKNKGRQRGKLMFVLKDQVEVKGTDALALAGQDKTPRVSEIIGESLVRVFGGGQ